MKARFDSPARFLLFGSLVLGVLTATTVAHADDEDEFTRSGPYFGVSGGAALPNFDGEFLFDPPPQEARVSEDASLSLSGRAGLRLHPNVAVEAQYEWVREWRIETRDEQCATADAQIITGNLRLFAPIGAVHPYVLGGVGAGLYSGSVRSFTFITRGDRCTPTPPVGNDFDFEHWELALRAGGGFDVYITRNVLINLEASTVYSDRRLLGETFPFVGIHGGLFFRF